MRGLARRRVGKRWWTSVAALTLAACLFWPGPCNQHAADHGQAALGPIWNETELWQVYWSIHDAVMRKDVEAIKRLCAPVFYFRLHDDDYWWLWYPQVIECGNCFLHRLEKLMRRGYSPEEFIFCAREDLNWKPIGLRHLSDEAVCVLTESSVFFFIRTLSGAKLYMALYGPHWSEFVKSGKIPQSVVLSEMLAVLVGRRILPEQLFELAR